jgi:Icc-related predicted phosphoesterase
LTRIVCISDTHLAHLPPQKIVVPDGDILVHAGDATFKGTREEVEAFAEWFDSLPHKRKVFVPGNHDCGFEFNWEAAVGLLPDYVDVLNDSGVTIAGLKFWGSPWQPEFCNWAFNLPRGEALRAHWRLIPEDTDVLVTHSPPIGFLDRVWRATPVRAVTPTVTKVKRYREHVGCADMCAAVSRIQPRLHVFGHIHCDVGVVHHTWKAAAKPPATGKTTFVNAAICDDRYLPVHPPVVIDL